MEKQILDYRYSKIASTYSNLFKTDVYGIDPENSYYWLFILSCL